MNLVSHLYRNRFPGYTSYAWLLKKKIGEYYVMYENHYLHESGTAWVKAKFTEPGAAPPGCAFRSVTDAKEAWAWGRFNLPRPIMEYPW